MDQLAHKVGSSVESLVRDVLGLAAKIPGSAYIGRYIIKSHQNDPARTVFEILLFLFAIRYFFASKQSYSKRDYVQLSDAEVDELIEEWEPAPLVRALTRDERMLLSEIPVLEGPADARPYTTVRAGGASASDSASASVNGDYAASSNSASTSNGSTSNGSASKVSASKGSASNGSASNGSASERLLNLTSTDLYGLSVDERVKRLAIDKVRYYGVGSCGPAGFYGNEDVHIACEDSLARLLGAERAILYSQGLSTAPSVIPCFAKRGDVLVVDDAVSMTIQRGLQLSRAKVLFFAHNDMQDLEQQLQKAVAQRVGKRLPRRFIVTEGLFEYTGNSPDLRRVVELKRQYKFRLILDESWSLGVLGASGRGVCEEQGIDRKEIDVTIGSLATAIGMYGGFCAGSTAVVEHQRIVSLSYTFSATEPPYLAGCTSQIVDELTEGKFAGRVVALREKALQFTQLLRKLPELDLLSRPDSPIVIFQLNAGDRVDDDDAAVSRLLHRAVLACRREGLLVARLGQIAEWETFGPVNAIKLYLPECLAPGDIPRVVEKLGRGLKQAFKDELR